MALAQDCLESEMVALLTPESDVGVFAAGGQQSPLRVPGATPHAAIMTAESLQVFQPHPATVEIAKYKSNASFDIAI